MGGGRPGREGQENPVLLTLKLYKLANFRVWRLHRDWKFPITIEVCLLGIHVELEFLDEVTGPISPIVTIKVNRQSICSRSGTARFRGWTEHMP